ncbi:MAG: suppressor of fused domain protein [Helicobacteraceae bacterium]|jgi:tetratricopeptide (TPR) repeat protein|nr:suppressor of fused domain protein [Helicobacteraceae bacterium]
MVSIEQLEKWHEDGKHQQIIDAVTAIPKDERDFELVKSLARAYTNMRKYSVAYDLLSAHKSEGIIDALWNWRMGLCLYETGKQAKAIPFLENAITLGDDNPETKNYLVLAKAFTTSFIKRTKMFWDWFGKNEKKLSEFAQNRKPSKEESDRSVEFIEQGVALLCENLRFNIGGDHEFTFAVGGRSELFFLLPYVIANMPREFRDKWTFFPCMQGTGGRNFSFGFNEDGVFVDAENVMVSATPSENGKFANLKFYVKDLESLEEEKRYSFFYIFMELTIGEALAHWRVGEVKWAGAKSDDMFPLTALEKWTLDNLCENGKVPDPADAWFTYEREPDEHPRPRHDIIVGSASCAAILRGYYHNEDESFLTFAGFGAKPAFLYYNHGGEQNQNVVLEERNALMDKLEAEILGERGSGREIGVLLGGAVGKKRAYIDLLLYDEQLFIEKARTLLSNTPYMIIFKEFYKDAEEILFCDIDLADPNLNERLYRLHDSESHNEIINILEALPKMSYEQTGLYARALNNADREEEAINALLSVKDEGENDAAWRYRYAYALYYTDRTEEALAEFKRAKELGDQNADEFIKICEDDLKKQQPELYDEDEMGAIESHIKEYFGDYESVFHEIASPDVHIDIVPIGPTSKRDRIVLVTMGVGARKMDMPEEADAYERFELVSVLPKDWNIQSEDEKDYWPIRTMKAMGRFPIVNETWLGWGHTVQFAKDHFTGADFVGYMLAMPLITDDEAGDVCALPDGSQVSFCQLIPLYEDEMKYKIDNGARSLMLLFHLAFGDDWDGAIDVTRKSVVDIALNEKRPVLRAIRKTTGYPYIYENLGRFLDSSHRYAEGIALLTEAIAANPVKVSLYAMRGELYMGANQPKEALDDFLHAITDVKALEDYWYMEVVYDHIGHLYEMFFNDAESALKYYRLALECDGEDAYAISCIGDLHCYYLDMYSKAIEYYDAAIELEPEEAKRYLKRAGAYKSLGMQKDAERDYSVALEAYLKKLEDTPDDKACHNCYVGECLLGLGRYEEALKYLNKAIECADSCETCPPRLCHEAYFALCRYYNTAGQQAKAKECLETAKKSSNAVQYNRFKIND